MPLQGSRVNPGRWDSELNPLPCDRYNNAELTIFLRVFLQQGNPARGAAKGTAREWGTGDATGLTGSGHGRERKIIRWTNGAWDRWTARYEREVQAFWSGKFWLVNTAGFAELDFTNKGETYSPNIWCRFNLEVTQNDSNAHTTITVVRLDPRETSFRSDSGHYDSRDIDYARHTHAGKAYRQRAHLHEVGHLLGMRHASADSAACKAAGNIGAEACYCATPEDCSEIMGSGEKVRISDAAPWLKAINEHGGGPPADWKVHMKRHYPRTLEEVRLHKEITTKPNRG